MAWYSGWEAAPGAGVTQSGVSGRAPIDPDVGQELTERNEIRLLPSTTRMFVVGSFAQVGSCQSNESSNWFPSAEMSMCVDQPVQYGDSHGQTSPTPCPRPLIAQAASRSRWVGRTCQ